MLGTLTAFGEPPPEKKAAEPEHKKLAIYTQKPPKAAVGDSELRKLQLEKFTTMQEAVELQMKVIEGRNWEGNSLAITIASGQRLVKSYLELEPTKEERLVFLSDYLDLTKYLEAFLKERFDAGKLKKQDYLQAMLARTDAEIVLTKAKAETKP